jgi:DNA replication regulator SLD3
MFDGTSPFGVEATPARGTLTSKPLVFPPMDDGFAIPPSSPILARKAAPSANPKYLSVPAGSGMLPKGHESEFLPSSPGLATLFETPVKPRSAAGISDRVVDVTPIKSKLPLVLNEGPGTIGNGTDKPSTSNDSREENIPPQPRLQSIYQRLGWDDDDLDDLA